MKPTSEQSQAIKLFSTKRNLLVNAFAGAGKTTTLQMMAEESRSKGLYLAFNKSIAEEAKKRFPKNVRCQTIHSLAFQSTPNKYRQVKEKMIGHINVMAIAQLLDVQHFDVGRQLSLSPGMMAYLTQQCLNTYCYSAADSIAPTHVPFLGRLSALKDQQKEKIATVVVEYAQKLWSEMIDASSDVPLGHDGYLKLWALGRPQISVDFILLDEAQDTNPVVLKVLEEQKSQLVFIGDTYQQIYGWRGAVNAMTAMPAGNRCDLSQSFRFGSEIANVANKVLVILGAKSSVQGVGKVQKNDSRTTVLCRKNATLIVELLRATQEGKTPYIVGGKTELEKLLLEVERLKEGRPSTSPEFFGFQNWEEVIEHSQTVEGEAIKTFVDIVEDVGELAILRALEHTARKEHQADIILSTAHKSKGREWDVVELADDYLNSMDLADYLKLRASVKHQEVCEKYEEELRLIYVAVTRARYTLVLPNSLLNMLNISVGKHVLSAEKISAKSLNTKSTKEPLITQKRIAIVLAVIILLKWIF